MALCLCVIICSVLLMNFERPRAAVGKNIQTAKDTTPKAATDEKPPAQAKEVPSAGTSVPSPLSAPSVIPDADPTKTIKGLLIPVYGVTANQLRDSFYDSRSEGRMHAALDIMAPHDTPVIAADDGTVLRLQQSERGGTMIYQADSTGDYVLYYGHLSRYADGVVVGKKLKRGEVIAYVGDTGNAGAGNYHLHFGISKMTSPGRWYGGEPVNPYPLLKGSNELSTAGK
jgi:murein DD-endopeptidase MepM/ murein hydrolase activator NlpD